MRLAHVDQLDGLTGGMLLGALIDAGLCREEVASALTRRTGRDLSLSVERVRRRDIHASRVKITLSGSSDLSLADFRSFCASPPSGIPSLPDAARVVTRLIEAEAQVRDVGDAGAAVAILAVCEGLRMLRVERLYSAPLPLPAGHGAADAAVAALAKDCPVRCLPHGTRVTPEGVALLSTLAHAFAPPPVFTLRASGYGTEGADSPGLVRVSLGDVEEAATETADEIVVIETNIDDMNPQWYGHLVDLLLERGALDAYLIPIIMKKGRPGTLLAALSDRSHVEDLVATILSETTTIGVRMHPVTRRKLARRCLEVDTRFGRIGVKAVRYGERVRFAPEYEDCRRAARQAGIPLAEVYDEVREATGRLDADGLP